MPVNIEIFNYKYTSFYFYELNLHVDGLCYYQDFNFDIYSY